MCLQPQGRRRNPKGVIMSCGCGRSPTGECIGWHGLTEEMYQEALAEYQASERMQQVNDLCYNQGEDK